MSNRYKGGIISATPPTTTGGESGTASGAWTLEQQMQAQAAGLWPLQPTGPYIEEVFNTWLYTGTGAAQTITNGIDLAGKGGLVWIKWRSGGGLGSSDNALYDTTRGVNNLLRSNTTGEQVNTGTGSNASVSAFNTTGFSLGPDALYGRVNYLNGLFASWTFREQAKFFDVVTYTGNGVAGRAIPHNLGSVPGCMIIKATSVSGKNWFVYHRALDATAPEDYYLFLDLTNARVLNGNLWELPTSTDIILNTAGGTNENGVTYVAYLFAHNAGGFGLSGTDNVISCGSYVGNGSATGPVVTLGYEPQWVLLKDTTDANEWHLFDNMRGIVTGGVDPWLEPNSSGAEQGSDNMLSALATGFQPTVNSPRINTNGATYVYIAIRRGPMRTPTTGTSVFDAEAYNGNSQINRLITTGFTTDVIWRTERFKTSGVAPAYNGNMSDRLSNGMLRTNLTDADNPTQAPVVWGSNVGVIYPTDNFVNNASGSSYILYGWQRAPGFFDEVCYTGNSTGGRTVAHNLAVAPELMIVKSRSIGGTFYDWAVYSKQVGATKYLWLNSANLANPNDEYWQDTDPTASVFSLGNGSRVNSSGQTYVAYLFASVPGVSKVGTYTGTGTTQLINCGFTGGARFVLIKRTDSTGDWFVWDTARGMIPANDPYLLLNSTAAEVTGTDFVDTAATGFEITSTAPAAINASGGTFIFLAIA
jgi:hypothetical protein